MFTKNPISEINKRKFEEELYERVTNEISEGYKRDGLWTKALVDASGDQEKAKPLYIKYRIQSLKDELIIQQQEELRIESKKQSDQLLVGCYVFFLIFGAVIALFYFFD